MDEIASIEANGTSTTYLMHINMIHSAIVTIVCSISATEEQRLWMRART
jgi:hypothetical protein